jgi:hypothetical protein
MIRTKEKKKGGGRKGKGKGLRRLAFRCVGKRHVRHAVQLLLLDGAVVVLVDDEDILQVAFADGDEDSVWMTKKIIYD